MSLPADWGWIVSDTLEGGRHAKKWFGDHYKEVQVGPDGDLKGAVALIEQEAHLRDPALNEQ